MKKELKKLLFGSSYFLGIGKKELERTNEAKAQLWDTRSRTIVLRGLRLFVAKRRIFWKKTPFFSSLIRKIVIFSI